MKLVAVNGRRYTADGLKAAVAATKTGGKLELLAESGDFFKTHALDYKKGCATRRWSAAAGKDVIAEILKPLGDREMTPVTPLAASRGLAAKSASGLKSSPGDPCAATPCCSRCCSSPAPLRRGVRPEAARRGRREGA